MSTLRNNFAGENSTSKKTPNSVTLSIVLYFFTEISAQLRHSTYILLRIHKIVYQMYLCLRRQGVIRGDFFRAFQLRRFTMQFELTSVILSILTRNNSVRISISCLTDWPDCLSHVCKLGTAEITSCLPRSFFANVTFFYISGEFVNYNGHFTRSYFLETAAM